MKYLVIVVWFFIVIGVAVNNVHGELPLNDSNLSGEGNNTAEDIRVETEKRADEKYDKSGRGSYKPEFIAVYGKLPEFKTEEQRRDWFDKVRPAILGELEYKTDQYFYPEGPLIALGDRPDGYIEATVLENSTVEKLLMDKIYGMIDDEAKKKNVREVPVRFVRGDFAQNDETLPDKISDKSVTGFGLLAGFVSLFSGWLFRRK